MFHSADVSDYRDYLASGVQTMWREMSVEAFCQHLLSTLAVVIVAYFSVGWVTALGVGLATLVVVLMGSTARWYAYNRSAQQPPNRCLPWVTVAARSEPLLPLTFALAISAYLLGGFWTIFLGGLAIAMFIAVFEPFIRYRFRSPSHSDVR